MYLPNSINCSESLVSSFFFSVSIIVLNDVITQYIPAKTELLNNRKTGFEKINIFPNPTSNYISITSENNLVITNAEVFIYDRYGRIVISTRYKYDRIDVSKLHPGIYFIRVITSSGYIVNNKFVVVN